MITGDGWRTPILRHFTRDIADATRLSVVMDEDALFSDPALLETVTNAGFELLPTDDPIALRYAYETRIRNRRDAGRRAPHAIVACRRRPVEATVPWDLLAIARREKREFAFGVTQLFPQLAPGVVNEMPRSMLDLLADALLTAPTDRRGELASRDFILRHVYKVPKRVHGTVDLLHVLLRRHHMGEVWHPNLDARFIHIARAEGQFLDWPLERLVPGRDTFFRFIEERWPRFVRASAGLKPEARSDDVARLSGPIDLPLGHDDVRVYIDTLFLEGRLARTSSVPAVVVKGSWVVVGVKSDEITPAEARARLEGLGKLLEDEVPSPEASHLAWGTAARRYSEWLAVLRNAPREIHTEWQGVPWRNTLEAAFEKWMTRRYAGLASLPAYPRPVMVHHVPEVMARELRDGKVKRVALVVMDGMSMSQWSSIRATLSSDETMAADEDVVFAWVPTITSVSRQALLAGEPPLYFGQTLGTTQKDEARWRKFWSKESLPSTAIEHLAVQGQGKESVQRVLETAARRGTRALAVTWTAIDQMVHRENNDRELHARVIRWASDGHFRDLIRGLLAEGYTVHVTADHGNVPARGIGRPNVGDTAEVRGQRVLVFTHDALRRNVAIDVPRAVSWPPIGLPEDYFALLAPAGAAFTTTGAEIVGHGGISTEEVVVPYVRFEVAT